MTPFSQASDRFFDLAHSAPSHFGASFSTADNYHDWFFSLGTTGALELILAITVQGECAMDPSRDYFEGRVRLLGRPADAGEDGEFSEDIQIDKQGLYCITGNNGRQPLQMTTCNQPLVSAHFGSLAPEFVPGNACEVIRKIIEHEQVRLQGLCMQAGAPLLWLMA